MDEARLEKLATCLGSYYLCLRKEHEKRKRNGKPLFDNQGGLDSKTIALSGEDEKILNSIRSYMKFFFDSQKEDIKIIFGPSDSPCYSIPLSNLVCLSKLEEDIQFSFYKD